MGQFELEWAEKVRTFLREVENKDLSINEIMRYPRWQRVWWLWLYNEHFEGTPMPENFPLELVKKIYGVD